jgi:hypothetical protein
MSKKSKSDNDPIAAIKETLENVLYKIETDGKKIRENVSDQTAIDKLIDSIHKNAQAVYGNNHTENRPLMVRVANAEATLRGFNLQEGVKAYKVDNAILTNEDHLKLIANATENALLGTANKKIPREQFAQEVATRATYFLDTLIAEEKAKHDAFPGTYTTAKINPEGLKTQLASIIQQGMQTTPATSNTSLDTVQSLTMSMKKGVEAIQAREQANIAKKAAQDAHMVAEDAKVQANKVRMEAEKIARETNKLADDVIRGSLESLKDKGIDTSKKQMDQQITKGMRPVIAQLIIDQNILHLNEGKLVLDKEYKPVVDKEKLSALTEELTNKLKSEKNVLKMTNKQIEKFSKDFEKEVGAEIKQEAPPTPPAPQNPERSGVAATQAKPQNMAQEEQKTAKSLKSNKITESISQGFATLNSPMQQALKMAQIIGKNLDKMGLLNSKAGDSHNTPHGKSEGKDKDLGGRGGRG